MVKEFTIPEYKMDVLTPEAMVLLGKVQCYGVLEMSWETYELYLKEVYQLLKAGKVVREISENGVKIKDLEKS